MNSWTYEIAQENIRSNLVRLEDGVRKVEKLLGQFCDVYEDDMLLDWLEQYFEVLELYDNE